MTLRHFKSIPTFSYPSQVGKYLPQKFLLNLLSIGDKRGEEMIGEVDKLTPKEGSWHAGKRWQAGKDAQMQGQLLTQSGAISCAKDLVIYSLKFPSYGFFR